MLGTSALQPGSIVEIRALGYMVMGEWFQRVSARYFDPISMVASRVYAHTYGYINKRLFFKKCS